ncbi:MAG: prenyltransferase/squalene oxidase repeat-containing protein [Planctomycetota bacterium]
MKRHVLGALLSGCLLAAAPPLRAQNDITDTLPKGVTPEFAAGIERALEYLARTQNNDGSWRNGGGFGSYPTAMTALAGMALLGSGSTPTRGRYYRQVRKATEYLIRCQGADGTISSLAEEGRSMYGHGFATMFLAEVYGMEEDRRRQEVLHDVLTKAVQLTARSQSRAGGWLYSPDQNGDEGSVTVTQIQALRACRNAGILVPVKTIENAVGYIRNSANPDGSIRYSAQGGGGGRPPITAAAVAVLYNAGRYDDPLAEKALEYARHTLPINGSGNGHHFYSHLYLSQSLWQRGGAEWEEYYPTMGKWLLTQQQRDGSWVGDGVGTTYGTAIALTILQLPYAYLPIYQR